MFVRRWVTQQGDVFREIVGSARSWLPLHGGRLRVLKEAKRGDCWLSRKMSGSLGLPGGWPDHKGDGWLSQSTELTRGPPGLEQHFDRL